VADLLYDDVPDIISKLVRTSLIAAPGMSLVVSDFSAIEGRARSWIAGEEWALEVYRTHGKIYEATASAMFNVPIELCGKGTDLRAKGKVAELALGYQGWTGALITMGALREGLQEAELPAIAKGWRNANPKTVKLWRKLEDAARHVIKNKTSYIVKGPYCDIKFSYEKGYMFITLPSGRRLAYYGAHISGRAIRYYGLDQVKKIWVKEDTYGGKLCENITQAIARDILYHAMYNMRDLDTLAILLHIHDEIVGEADDDKAEAALVAMENIMSVGPTWAKGLPLKGDGYISKYYKKD
jgi:DNA polymerase